MSQNLVKSARIDVADVLRGIAVLAIFLLHAIEHFNFGAYPDPATRGALLKFFDVAIWDGLFFVFAGKAYAIFAFLFGFSFYLQDRNEQLRGGDFRLRFCWRLVLLFLLGNLNAVFFTGEVLVLYSIVGFVMPLTCRMSTKWLVALGFVLLLQPLHIVYGVISIFDADFVLPAFQTRSFWMAAKEMQLGGSFLQMAKVNLWEGQLASLAWAWDNARFFQSAALFIFGMVVGRLELLSRMNLSFWYRAGSVALVFFFPLKGLVAMMTTEYIANGVTASAFRLILNSLANFSFSALLVSAVVVAYYNSSVLSKWLSMLIPYGRMSLSNYLMQSVVGAFIFYNWGLGLYDVLGVTYSFLVGIALFLLQYAMCRVWLSRFSSGPFEYLWRRATWLC